MNFEKPDNVRDAQIRGDREALSRMGKKGAAKATETKAYKASVKAEDEAERMAEAERAELIHEHGEERTDEMYNDTK